MSIQTSALPLAILIASTALSATAQTELEDIVVEGNAEDATGPVKGYVAKASRTGTKTDETLLRIDSTINVVPAQQIEDQNAKSVAEALRYTPGVFTEYRGTSNLRDETYVRGFGYVPRYLDGLSFGSNSRGQIDPWLLERVEVIKGPASVLYGQANPGGIINLITKKPTGETFRRARIGTGNLNQANMALDMGGTIPDNDDLSWRIVGTAWQQDAQEDGLKQRRFAFSPSLTWAPDSNRRLTISAIYQNEPDAGFRNFRERNGTVDPTSHGLIPREFLVSDPDYQKSERQTWSVAAQYEQDLGQSTKLRSNFRYSDIDHTYRTLTWGSLQQDDSTITRTASGGTDDWTEAGLDTSIEHRFFTGSASHTLLAGIDLRRAERDYRWGFNFSAPSINWRNPVYGVDPATLPLKDRVSDTNTVAKQAGIYVSDRVEIDRLILSGGLRFDWFETELRNNQTGTTSTFRDTAVTGHVGALYTFDNGVAPYISYSTSFEPVNETPPPGLATFDPSEGKQFELGLKWASPDDSIFVQAAVFDITQTGVLQYNRALRGFEQVGKIESRGFELETRAEINDRVSLIGAYSYIDAKVTEANNTHQVGKSPARLPANQASIWARYGAPSGFDAALGLRYIGSSWGDNTNSFKVPAATLVDLAFGYDFGARNPRYEGLRAQLNVQNLTDKFFTASCASQFACFVGSGRVITASLAFEF